MMSKKIKNEEIRSRKRVGGKRSNVLLLSVVRVPLMGTQCRVLKMMFRAVLSTKHMEQNKLQLLCDKHPPLLEHPHESHSGWYVKSPP